MKRSISTLVLASISIPMIAALAQDKKPAPKTELPPAVKAGVEAHYPHGEVVKSKMEKENGKEYYESVLAVKIEAKFASDGSLVEQEQAIDPSALPAAVSKAIAGSKYAGGKVEEAELVFHTDSSSVVYEIEVKVGDKTTEVAFDATGKILSEESEDEDEGDDDDSAGGKKGG